jgi:hypothetical protein
MTDMTTDTAQATVEAAHELLNAAGLPADTLAGRIGRLVAERDRYRQALVDIAATPFSPAPGWRHWRHTAHKALREVER